MCAKERLQLHFTDNKILIKGKEAMSLTVLLARTYLALEQELSKLRPPYTLYFSLCDAKSRARVVHAQGQSFIQAWEACRVQALKIEKTEKLDICWLRIDWVFASKESSWEKLKKELALTKRNYFRRGLALDPEFKISFLEQELNANAMLYGGNQTSHAVVNEKNFSAFARKRYGSSVSLDFSPDKPVYILHTKGIFSSRTEGPLILNGPGRDMGRRTIQALDEYNVYELIHNSSNYLASQVTQSGQFHYGWHPCFDRPIRAYNNLRHASSIYSMLEAWEVTADEQLGASIHKALDYLISNLIKKTKLPDGATAAFLVETNNEIKLGGNGVCLLALSKYTALTGKDQYLSLMEQLALGICHMQNPQNGKFVHVLEYPSLRVKEKFRIIYYDGEAAFGLMRLYGLTKDSRWLSAVEKAFDHFINAKHWQAHDHWLSYCVNELTLYKPEEKYFKFGIDNFSDHLDFILKRITTFPTLLELMMAAEKMITRLKNQNRFKHLISRIDLQKFYEALEFRAHYLLNGHFWPESAMYFQNPKRILGSFYIRHHAFRVRIDDVEHYLSGFVSYRQYLLEKKKVIAVEAPAHTIQTEPAALSDNWDAESLVHATSGAWIIPPKTPNWRATGLCIFPPGMRPGNIVVVRSPNGDRFIPPKQLGSLPYIPQAIITDDPEFKANPSIPVLKVSKLRNAILGMGRYARSRNQGTIIGITGSSGKTTTVALLHHLLRPWGNIGKTEHNANLPLGISWNLASMPWGAPFTVLEMAVGNMKLNSEIAKPDIAIITNIHPAHLEYHSSTEEIARKKSRIFSGMKPGSIAVINRDIPEWPIIEAEANSHSLKIVTFGEHPLSQYRLKEYAADTGRTVTDVNGIDVEFISGARGQHMAMNCLACIAAIHSLGLGLEPVLPLIPLFKPLLGRGNSSTVQIHGKRVRLIDEAYNANPASMKAALLLAGETTLSSKNAKKILVLGDMRELGENSQKYHGDLVPHIKKTGAARVLLLGKEIGNIHENLVKEGVNSSVHPDSSHIKREILNSIENEDLLFFKGSHGSGLHLLVKELLELCSEPST
ncbi:UDP-N-acetylmuramoyl-tripeptide--D-alanyl-D-alanine ligase [Microbulbifer pacificus]|uniref:UDP-N-acetylmuramoyl-tripeptide--D-alanyl-D- alanine ligase n=1 Tax=Microbulbifer pacificus TaxID=407164 RepID=UPI000CF3D87E|nr:UDP-N-acetylmuramoyl-tripeptide--D-alanyl-D-alanine ligase [Microbulbifer pacificus]